MDHFVERTIFISMNKEEARALNILLEEFKILRDDACDSYDWTEIERKVIQDMQDILTMY